MMKRNMMTGGLLLMALAMSFGLSGCGRSKQNAALALDEARLNIASARSAGAQKYAPQKLKEAEAALKLSEKSFGSLEFDAAKTQAQTAIRLAGAAQAEAEKKAAEKAVKTVKKSVAAVKNTVKQIKKK
jgi:hypothetical protein